MRSSILRECRAFNRRKPEVIIGEPTTFSRWPSLVQRLAEAMSVLCSCRKCCGPGWHTHAVRWGTAAGSLHKACQRPAGAPAALQDSKAQLCRSAAWRCKCTMSGRMQMSVADVCLPFMGVGLHSLMLTVWYVRVALQATLLPQSSGQCSIQQD